MRATSSAGAQLAQTLERRLYHVRGVVRAQTLGADILDPRQLHHGTDSAAGNNAGTFGGGLQQDLAGAENARDLVRNGVSLQGNGDHILLSVFNSLADRVGNLRRLPETVADSAVAVAHHHNGGEAGDPSALHGLGTRLIATSFPEARAARLFQNFLPY